MAYIAPDSNVRILHNVPLDADYLNTKDFASASNQSAYFMGLTKYNLANINYQRANKNTIRVEIRTELLYDCNYMMFQNTAFGNKWFYAFITKVDYINNITSEITYELDVMQTWQFDYTLNMCYVEREHSATDNAGDNIVPENLPLGEYVFNSYNAETDFGQMAIIVAIVDVEGATSAGNMYDGVYGGATLHAFPATSGAMPNIDNLLSQYIQSPESVISIYMCDRFVIDAVSIPDTGVTLAYKQSGITMQKEYTLDTVAGTIDGYIPMNKKLFTYPYNFFHVDNGLGNELVLRYEFFDNLRPLLVFSGTLTQPVQLVCRPAGYKGLSRGGGLAQPSELYDESISIEGYPMCSWNVDAFRAWIAQNAIPIAIDTLGLATLASSGSVSALAGTKGAVDPSPLGLVTGTLTGAYRASIASDLNKGTFVNGGVNVARGVQRFNTGRKSINHQMAQIIDDYFTRFGYATNRVKQPYTNTRPSFNYLKTIGCTINGSIPCDDEKKICAIYDRGVTFWHEGKVVGGYYQDNRPA